MTVIGVQIGYLLGGLDPGGDGLLLARAGASAFPRAISSRDLPLVQGGVMFVSAVFGLVNLAVDLLYAALDPRVRYPEP